MQVKLTNYLTTQILSVNKVIKTIRVHLKLTQEEFANSIGTTRANLGQIETGKSNPTAELLISIVNKFHIDMNIFKLKTENDAFDFLHSRNAQFHAQFPQQSVVSEPSTTYNTKKTKESLEEQVSRLQKEVKSYKISVDKLNLVNVENSMELVDRIFAIDQLKSDVKRILAILENKKVS